MATDGRAFGCVSVYLEVVCTWDQWLGAGPLWSSCSRDIMKVEAEVEAKVGVEPRAGLCASGSGPAPA